MQRQFGRYVVCASDHTVAVRLNPKAGPYRSDLSDRGPLFVNHDFRPKASYSARVRFTPTSSRQLKLRPLTAAEIATMKSADGEQKRVEHQRIGKRAGWELRFYSYPGDYDFQGRRQTLTIQCLDLLKIVAGKLVTIETALSYEEPYDRRYEDLIAELSDGFEVVETGPRVAPTDAPVGTAAKEIAH